MEALDLWFKCKNRDCGLIPYKTKTEKVKRAWKHGLSVASASRQRLFMRGVEGFYHYKNHGDRIEFETKYGLILIYESNDTGEFINSTMYPIDGQEECAVCIKKKINERALFNA